VGDRITVPFVCACGSCPRCLVGEHQVCDRQTQPGFTHWGSFADLVALEEADLNLVPLPESLSFATAASLGCRFATAYRAVVQVGRVQAQEQVVVLGCGGVGLSAVQVAVAAGAQVVAVDVSPGALELARAFGASAAVDARAGEVVAAVREATGGGAHLSLDALGSAQTCVDSVLGLRPRGRHVQVGLLPPSQGRPLLPMERVIGLELEVLGSHGMAAHSYPELLELVVTRRLRPDLLVTATVGLDGAAQALTEVGRSPGLTVLVPS
jgi:D-arabinose 1-dehydrogenase-like Zn-dependent alcohol dehydrogenase